jgi:AcrR family transcriptional regulator
VAVSRDSICRALIALVGERGYEPTSVEEICERAGADRDEFALHFADKRQCIEAVWEEMTSDYICTCRGAYMNEERWRDGLRAAGYAALQWLMADEMRARFFLIEVMSGGEMVRARRDWMMNEFVDMLEAGRHEPAARARGRSRATAEAVTGAIYENAIDSIRKRENLEQACDRVRRMMYIATLPYCGAEAAEEELAIPPPAGLPAGVHSPRGAQSP